MDFFERQRAVRSSSARLVVLFVLAVVAIVAVLDLLAYVAMRVYLNDPGGEGMREVTGVLPPDVWAVVATTIVVLLIIGLTSLVRIALLKRGGGVAVAKSMGAVPLEDLQDSPTLRRYRNVVEEIAIASSTPVPRLFVMTKESAINAFAAGSTPADAAVAVTQGSLERLNRDELQGVIAHEFSHIVNGDMRLSIRLMGLLAGITGLAVAGRVILQVSAGGRRGRSSSSNSGGGGAAVLVILVVGLAAIVVGYIGVFFARMIKASVSRQREYLADASAVQYTRQSAGLAGALKKIGGLETGSRLKSKRTENVSHMLFGEGLSVSRLFATHPPLPERIAVLEPGFVPEQLTDLRARWRDAPPDGMREDLALGLSTPTGERARPAQPHRPPQPGRPPQPAPGSGPRAPLPGQQSGPVARRVGTPSERSFEIGSEVMSRIPPHLLDAARRPDLALPLTFGLVLDPDARIRAGQQHAIASAYNPATAQRAVELGGEVSRLPADLRLPLAELAFPALRAMPDAELSRASDTLRALIAADGHTSVLEYCLSTLVGIGLHEARTHAPPWPARRTNVARAQGSITTLLSVLAWVGAPDRPQAERAFLAGAQVISPSRRLTFTPPRGLEALDGAWAELDGLQGADKAALVDAIATTAWADNRVTVAEAELVRLVCGILHCPLPPLDEAVA